MPWFMIFFISSMNTLNFQGWCDIPQTSIILRCLVSQKQPFSQLLHRTQTYQILFLRHQAWIEEVPMTGQLIFYWFCHWYFQQWDLIIFGWGAKDLITIDGNDILVWIFSPLINVELLVQTLPWNSGVENLVLLSLTWKFMLFFLKTVKRIKLNSDWVWGVHEVFLIYLSFELELIIRVHFI